jgi:hypothetical protein
MKTLSLPLTATILLACGPQAIARTVSHQVTPKNIDEQPFAFKVTVSNASGKDGASVKDFEIRVGPKSGQPAPGPAESGGLELTSCGKKKVETPPVTIVKSGSALIYTFRVSDRDLDRSIARFTFAVPSPGDNYQFDLDDFLLMDESAPVKPAVESQPPTQTIQPEPARKVPSLKVRAAAVP